jgi:hypothetical protein
VNSLALAPLLALPEVAMYQLCDMHIKVSAEEAVEDDLQKRLLG